MMMRNHRRATLEVTALVAVLGLTLCACRRKRPPAPSVSSTPVPTWTAPIAPPTRSEPMYHAKGVDLCKLTDLSPLSDLKIKIDLKDPKRSHGDASCFYKLHTATRRDANLLVDVTTLKSVDEAKDMCRALRKHGVMNHEGSLSGIGDEADGYALEKDKKEYQEAEYMIRARYENMVIEVWLAVFDRPLIPKATLSEKVRTIVKASAALVPKS